MSTSVKITKLPERCTLLLDAAPVVLDQVIPFVDWNKVNIEKTSVLRGAPFDFFKYIVEVDGIESNESEVEINFDPTTDVYVPDNITVTKNLFEEFLFSDQITYQQCWDRIIFDSITGKGSWYIDEQKVEIGKVYFAWQIWEKLKFVADEIGAKTNYNILTYRVGNITDFFGVTNSITVDVNSLGISEIAAEPNKIIDLDGNYNLYFSVNIQKGYDSGTASFEIDTTSLSQLIADPLNSLTIVGSNGFLDTINTLANTGFEIDTNEFGELTLSFHLFLIGSSVSTESLYFELKKINGETANVDSLNTVLTFNLL